MDADTATFILFVVLFTIIAGGIALALVAEALESLSLWSQSRAATRARYKHRSLVRPSQPFRWTDSDVWD